MQLLRKDFYNRRKVFSQVILGSLQSSPNLQSLLAFKEHRLFVNHTGRVMNQRAMCLIFLHRSAESNKRLRGKKISKIEKEDCILKHEELITKGSFQIISIIPRQIPMCACACGGKYGGGEDN